MKITFKAHPVMTLTYLKPFLFVLVFPVIKGLVQYIRHRRVSGILPLETGLFIGILVIAILRYRSFSITVDRDKLTVKSGFLYKSESEINLSRLSSVSSKRNPIDVLFKSVTFSVNTEAGRPSKPDFKFKLYLSDAKHLSKILYGEEEQKVMRYSSLRIAVLSMATSSAITGLVLGVPVINRTGKLLGLALSEMVFDEINQISGKVNTVFPPVVNIITIILTVAYTVSFLTSFFKNMRFRLRMSDEKVEIQSGFFVRRHTEFKKSAVKNICMEQSPIMRPFKMFTMRAAIGGYGDGKGEKAVIVPVGRLRELKKQFAEHFSFLQTDKEPITAEHNRLNIRRFLWLPQLYAGLDIAVSVASILIFPYFDRMVLFLGTVLMGIILYYGSLSYRNMKYGRLSLSENIFASNSVRLTVRELYCKKGDIGTIKLIRTLPDIKYNACKVQLIVRSESADKITVRNLDYDTVIKEIEQCFEIKV